MSDLKVMTLRHNDQRVLKVSLFLNYKEKFDYANISFKCNNIKLHIISTSNGSIDNEENIKLKSKRSEIYIDYCSMVNKLECLVGYMLNNELIYYETLTGFFNNNLDISKTQISLRKLKTVSGTYLERFRYFFDTLSKIKSSWLMEISCPDDILINIVKSGKQPIMISFGENCKDMLASDFVFQIDPQIEILNLPKEILIEREKIYNPGCKLGIHELVCPDFIGANNVCYKTLISNTLTISDCVNK